MSTAYIRYPAVGAGGGLAIGQAVVDGDPSSVLYIDATGELAQDADFLFDAANHDLTIGEFSIRGSALSAGSFSYGGTAYFGGGGTLGMYMQAAMISYPGVQNIGVLLGTTHYPFGRISSTAFHVGYDQGDTAVAAVAREIRAKEGGPLSLTADGVKMPSFTTTQKNALTASAGMVVFDSTLSKLCVYTGAAWETITSV